MALHGIKLRRFEIRQANHYALHGFRLRVEVAEVTGDTPREIFVYRRHPVNPDTNQQLDEFLTVASFVDLAEYPANAPDPEKNLAFFRKDFIELDVRSSAHYEEVWRIVRTEAAHLVAALNRAEQLEVAEEIWIGEPSPASASSASSPVVP